MRLKEIRMTTVMSLALAFALAASAEAQQPTDSGREKQRGGQMMSMDEMMKECRRRCQETVRYSPMSRPKISEFKVDRRQSVFSLRPIDFRRPLPTIKSVG